MIVYSCSALNSQLLLLHASPFSILTLNTRHYKSLLSIIIKSKRFQGARKRKKGTRASEAKKKHEQKRLEESKNLNLRSKDKQEQGLKERRV